jgi:hypothetical protein
VAEYVPSIALPKTWATCSAIGPSDLAHWGHRLGQLVGERREQSDVPVGCLGELRLSESVA